MLKIADTSVRLRWSEPRQPNGVLQGYQVHLLDIAQNATDVRRVQDPQRGPMEHLIGELRPFTWYQLQLAAYSHRFVGEPSAPIKLRTDVSAPGQPDMVNVTCLTRDSLMIVWQRPERFFGQLDYYYVQYKPVDAGPAAPYEETKLQAKRDKALNELLITNLTADLAYELRILAGTRSIVDPQHVYRSDSSQTLRVVLQDNCESKYSIASI